MTKKFEPSLYLIRYIDEDFDRFWYNGNHPLFQDVIDDLIDRCHLTKIHDRVIQKLTDEQIMMLKLCCPITLIIIN
jgi:hypothetical protein